MASSGDRDVRRRRAGRRSLSGETFTADSPATGETIGEVPQGDRDDAQLRDRRGEPRRRRAGRARRAFERAAALHRVADAVERRRDELARTLTLDQGKPIAEARDEVEELVAVLAQRRRGRQAARGPAAELGLARQAVLLFRRPRGVIGVITPWNWPYTMPAELIAPALACGNTVVWTPASTTAIAAVALAECVAEADLPPGVFNLVTGPGLGRRRRDRAQPRHARRRLHRLDRDRAARSPRRRPARRPCSSSAATARSSCSTTPTSTSPPRRRSPPASSAPGQSCTAGERLLVHRDVREEFVAKLARARHGARRARRPVRRADDDGPAEQRRRRRRRWTSTSPTRSSAARSVVSGGARADGFPTDALLAGDGARRRPGRLARRAGGDVRPGRAGRRDRLARAGDRADERVAVRAALGDLHARPRARACASPTRCAPAG